MEKQTIVAGDTISSCVPNEIWGNSGAPASSLWREFFGRNVTNTVWFTREGHRKHPSAFSYLVRLGFLFILLKWKN